MPVRLPGCAILFTRLRRYFHLLRRDVYQTAQVCLPCCASWITRLRYLAFLSGYAEMFTRLCQHVYLVAPALLPGLVSSIPRTGLRGRCGPPTFVSSLFVTRHSRRRPELKIKVFEIKISSKKSKPLTTNKYGKLS